jgi:predicted nucleic acid-binding protein
MIIADTDVLIDYLAGKGEADTVEELLRRGAIRTMVISRFELLSGAKSAKQVARLVQLLWAVPSLRLDDAAADSASEILRSLDREGSPLGWRDSLIAGIVALTAARY